MNKNVLNFVKSLALWFCIFYLTFWAYQTWFSPTEEKTTVGDLTVELVDKTPVVGQLVQARIKNQTADTWTWEHFCTDPVSLQLQALVANKEVEVTMPECKSAPYGAVTVAPQSTTFISLPEFNTDLFTTPGNYRLNWQFKNGEETQDLTTADFEVGAPGFWRKGFRALVTQPLFNALVWFIEVLPNHSLGWAIVLLTIGVRLILFLPNQKAMRSQRKLQKLQPHIEALRKKYGKNQQAMALETMSLYKNHKINPMSSCLPMLAQMPFLIGIYLVVKDGLSPHLSYLLYPFASGADLSVVDSQFFGLDLEIPNILVLPVLVAGAQFLAIKLSLAAAKKTQPPKSKKKVAKKDEAPDMMNQMEQMQKMMLWMLPLMIGFFTATFPAAVGIYWLTSTVFGIGQQKLVNWQLDQPEVRRKD